MAALRLNLAVEMIGKLLSPLFFALKGFMKLKNQKLFLIIKDGDLLEPKEITEKLESSIVIFERLLNGQQLEKVYFEAAKTELENLKHFLLVSLGEQNV